MRNVFITEKLSHKKFKDNQNMEKLIKKREIELPPLRSLDDFLLSSDRFQLPNLQDFEKWGSRVVNNLMYYQTNYIVVFAIIFLIIG